MFGSTVGFRGRRIEWHYFRFRQIQDGGSAAILENLNGDISLADRPIYFVFGSRMGFSGSSDRMALFPVSPNPRWRRHHLLTMLARQQCCSVACNHRLNGRSSPVLMATCVSYGSLWDFMGFSPTDLEVTPLDRF